MAALKKMALVDTSIFTLVGDRIWINRIPRATVKTQDALHPDKMLVLRMAGGAGKADTLHSVSRNIDAICYGETDEEANKVRRAVEQLFIDLDREIHNDVLIHHINPTGGPIPSVEPDFVWPVIAQSFVVLANLKEV